MTNQIRNEFDKVIKNLKLSKENIDFRKNLEKFINWGFPNKNHEDWKFSDLNNIIFSNIKDLKYFNKELFNKESKNLITKDILSYNLFEHNKIVISNGIVSVIDFKYEDIKEIDVINTSENQSSNTKKTLTYLNNAFNTNYLKLVIKKIIH